MPFTERYVTTVAAGGGDGLAEGTAWTLPEAAAAAAVGMRINVKAGTYNRTTTVTFSTAGPYRVEAYTAAPGDGGRAVIDGGTSGVSYALLTDSTSRVTYVGLTFQNNGASGSAAGVTCSGGGDPLFIRCVFASLRGSGAVPASGNLACFIECEAYGCNQGNAGNSGGWMGGSVFVRCIAHDNMGSNSQGFGNQNNNAITLIDCIADSNGSHGLLITSTSAPVPVVVRGCDFYANGGSGIKVDALAGSNRYVIQNSNFVKNGGYGINNAGTGTNTGEVTNCGFGSGTQANTSGTTTGLGNISESGTVTYASGVTPWVDPANGDFRVSLAAAKGAGRGTFTQTQASYTGTIAYPDIGAAQHLETTDYPAVGNVRLGIAYNSGAAVGTLALPTAAQVQSGVGFGAGATEFTGTYLPTCDYPIVGNVKAGVVYGSGTLTGTFLCPQTQCGIARPPAP